MRPQIVAAETTTTANTLSHPSHPNIIFSIIVSILLVIVIAMKGLDLALS
ncbi:hypothetical protein B4U79_15823 [Dinothrombium tinctorium]|uniref:Uncharacterized protein n=1 Tax=Dinothrombium tinctorium TaxID=1965070 RepID=A0A3S3S368_9ACAR|nr:hypothetical protein B4U79_15823 [Dinothrombium tinctorium]